MSLCSVSVPSSHVRHHSILPFTAFKSPRCNLSSSTFSTRRRTLSLCVSIISSSLTTFTCLGTPPSESAAAEFYELPDSGGIKVLDLRIGSGRAPVDGDQVAIHYYGRLAAKQGWRFDSTYDHKDENGEPIPFSFVLGSGKVIRGIQVAVQSMKLGGISRVVIPPSQGYQNTNQEPLPPNMLVQNSVQETDYVRRKLVELISSALRTRLRCSPA